MKKLPTLISVLQDAIQSGYIHHFFLEENILTIPWISKTFYLSEVHKKVFACPITEANLYLISTYDGQYKGTLILDWTTLPNEI